MSQTKSSEFKSVLIVACIAFAIRVFVFELFFVPTGSMKATILEGDYILSTKYSYGYCRYSLPFSPNIIAGRLFGSLPKRGDIVVTKSPHDMSTRFLKRVIGLPGDKVQIIDDAVYINDVAMTREKIGLVTFENNLEYVKYRDSLPGGFRYFSYKRRYYGILGPSRDFSNFGPYHVPPGSVFLMGDNRDESADSRGSMGFVPVDLLIGKARVIIYSFKERFIQDDIGLVEQILRIGTWLKSFRLSRSFYGLYSDAE